VRCRGGRPAGPVDQRRRRGARIVGTRESRLQQSQCLTRWAYTQRMEKGYVSSLARDARLFGVKLRQHGSTHPLATSLRYQSVHSIRLANPYKFLLFL
jgi:hypothetical protein